MDEKEELYRHEGDDKRDDDEFELQPVTVPTSDGGGDDDDDDDDDDARQVLDDLDQTDELLAAEARGRKNGKRRHGRLMDHIRRQSSASQMEAGKIKFGRSGKRRGIGWWLSCRGCLLMSVCLSIGFVAVAIVVSTMSHRQEDGMLRTWNGTAYFEPTVVLISLDGVPPSYITPNGSPSLYKLQQEAVTAQFMQSCFPTLTFPNHFSIVTGLYPESHGIVANNFYSPSINATFSFTCEECNNDDRWWQGGEPIWNTAERNHMKSAVCMWPGSMANIHGHKASIVDAFDDTWSPMQKVDRGLGWLDYALVDRPSFIALYIPQIDEAGQPDWTRKQACERYAQGGR